MKKTIGLLAIVKMSSYSAQQFTVNANTETFSSGGIVWREGVENGLKNEFKKDMFMQFITFVMVHCKVVKVIKGVFNCF